MIGKVIIGITTKNREAILPQALNSAINQGYDKKEISVFDDNSCDNTRNLINEFPQVKWFFSPVSRGLVFARNLFLTTTDAEYYCSLDDDSWFTDNDGLRMAVEYMDSHPSVAALAFNILSPDKPSGSLTGLSISETNNFIGCGHLLRVKAVNAVGNYPVNPGFYGAEEKDLCIRLIDAGFSIVRMPHIRVWHDKTTISRDLMAQHRSGVCNDMSFMWRRTPATYLWPSFIKKILVNFTFPIRYRKLALYKPFLLGLSDFLKYLFSGRLHREPVSRKGLHKYLSLRDK